MIRPELELGNFAAGRRAPLNGLLSELRGRFGFGLRLTLIVFVFFAGASILLPAGASADDASQLLSAAGAGNSAKVSSLLSGGADPNGQDDEGVSALHVAATRGHTQIVEMLLTAGAEVDLQEFDGDTALINASAFGQTAVVEVLLGAGADDSIESSQGYSAVQLARRGRHKSTVKMLSKWKVAARKAAAGRAGGAGGQGRPQAGPALPESNAGAPSARPRLPAKTYRPGYARRIAAVIGVNDYQYWPALSGARGDAEKVSARLKGLGFDEVFELYDQDATRGAILSLLGSKLGEATGENDLVVIFFAGHGQTETIGGDRKRGYIIPVDATVESVFSTAIPMQKLRELTNRLPAKHVYYAMDSCYSGLGFTRGISIVKPSSNNYINKVTSLRAVQMVTAGGEGEEAIERNGEGVFTRSFLDALEGKADSNGDGYVTATEIGAYVAPRVTNETDARQSPQAGRLEGEGEIAFRVGG
ncbi:MAG: ankyrin repeat domain-containing protein [Myxococcota bacterium]